MTRTAAFMPLWSGKRTTDADRRPVQSPVHLKQAEFAEEITLPGLVRQTPAISMACELLQSVSSSDDAGDAA
jgi:hypothetical protein